MALDSPKLRILRQETRSAAGQAIELTVFCPRRQRTLPIDKCADCEYCNGYSFDQSGRDSFLSCVYQFSAPAISKAYEPSTKVTTVGDIMERDVVGVSAESTLEEITRLLLERGISGVPVVDGDSRPIGIVSKTDLLRKQHEEPDTLETDPLRVRTEGGYYVELGQGFHLDRIRKEKVTEVMTPVVATANSAMPVPYAAGLMTAAGVHRLVVVSDQGRVVGLLSSMKVLRWLAESHGYIRQADSNLQ